jgi:hypothetical protein
MAFDWRELKTVRGFFWALLLIECEANLGELTKTISGGDCIWFLVLIQLHERGGQRAKK